MVVEPGQHFHVLTGGSAVKFLYRIQAESAYTFGQPEIHDSLKFFPQCLAFKVHIGHATPEYTLVVIIRRTHLVPGIGAGVAFYEMIVFIVGAFFGKGLLSRLQGFQMSSIPCSGDGNGKKNLRLNNGAVYDTISLTLIEKNRKCGYLYRHYRIFNKVDCFVYAAVICLIFLPGRFCA